jgi:hypothetical protein
MKLLKFLLPILLLIVAVSTVGVSSCIYSKSPFKDAAYCSKVTTLLFRSTSDSSAFVDLIKETTSSKETNVAITHPTFEDNAASLRSRYGFDIDEIAGSFVSFDGDVLTFTVESTAIELKPAQDFLVLCSAEVITFNGVEIKASEMMIDYSNTSDSDLIKMVSGYSAVNPAARTQMLKEYTPGKTIKVAMKDSQFRHVGIFADNCEQLYKI